MTDDRKQAEEIEREILQEFFDNGDIVDDNFGRFYEMRKGIISTAMLDFHAQQLAEIERYDAEDFLQTKDIWNHPFISDRLDKNAYEVADLMAEFVNSLRSRLSKKEDKPAVAGDYSFETGV